MLNVLLKKQMITMAFALCLAVLFAVGCSKDTPPAEEKAKGAAADTIELRVAHHWPAKHRVETDIVQGWAKAIGEATNGRVKIVSYPGETLVSAAENYQGVVDGVTDIGIGVYGYTRGRFPVIETFLLPGVNAKSAQVLGHAAVEVLEKLNPKEIQDTKQLFTFGSGPMDLLSKKPVRKLEDLKGIPLGVPGGKGSETLKALGGAPVSMPMSEWYEGLQKGVMQGGFVAVTALDGFRLGEVTADYITFTPFLPQNLFYCVMNLKKWESLPADLQETILKVTKEFYPGHVPSVWDEDNVAALKRLSEKKKVELIRLSQAETGRWLKKVEFMQEAYVKELKDKGLPGEEILKTIKETVAAMNQKYPDVNYSGQ